MRFRCTFVGLLMGVILAYGGDQTLDVVPLFSGLVWMSVAAFIAMCFMKEISDSASERIVCTLVTSAGVFTPFILVQLLSIK